MHCRLAHAALEQHQEACECFHLALQLEPGNEMYKTNLQQSEQKLRDATAAVSVCFYYFFFSELDLAQQQNCNSIAVVMC